MSRVIIDTTECLVCHENKCIIFPKYVVRLLRRLDYYCYDVKAFLDAVDEVRKIIENNKYDELPEWIRLHVPKRYIKALSKHLLWLHELI